MANAIEETATSVPYTFPLYQPYKFYRSANARMPPCGPEHGPHTYQFTSDRSLFANLMWQLRVWQFVQILQPVSGQAIQLEWTGSLLSAAEDMVGN